MKLENLEFYEQNEEDFSEILYENRKKYYEESKDYFVFDYMNDAYIVDVNLVHEVIPGKYSSGSECPDEFYDSTSLVGWVVERISLFRSAEAWNHEEFLRALDEKGRMCFNSELKKFIDLHE
jgi:hypothetical protein